MRRLVVVVACTAPRQVRQQIKRELAVRLGVDDFLVLVFGVCGVAISFPMGKSPRFTSLRDERDKATMCQAEPETSFEPALKVSTLLELLGNPGRPDAVFVLRQLFSSHLAVVLSEVVVNGFSGQHTRLHCIVRAFDLRDVEEARRAACEHAAREGKLGNRVVATLVEDTRSVLDALASFEHFSNISMRLQLLELLVRVKVWVLIVQADH